MVPATPVKRLFCHIHHAGVSRPQVIAQGFGISGGDHCDVGAGMPGQRQFGSPYSIDREPDQTSFAPEAELNAS